MPAAPNRKPIRRTNDCLVPVRPSRRLAHKILHAGDSALASPLASPFGAGRRERSRSRLRPGGLPSLTLAVAPLAGAVDPASRQEAAVC
jgi:hypothetical protein